MSSPNAFAFPTALVLTNVVANINSPTSSVNLLVESRRVENGIYFHYLGDHVVNVRLSFSVLATPYNAPRSRVDTYIV